jgi:hypothetical protein
MTDDLTAYNLDRVLVGVLGHEFYGNKLIIKLDCKTSEEEGEQEREEGGEIRQGVERRGQFRPEGGESRS